MEIIHHPADTGLYSNISLGPAWFRAKNKTVDQTGWDEQYDSLCKTFFKREESPYAVFMTVGSISYFDNPKAVLDSRTRAIIEKKGLRIYLADALSTYALNKPTVGTYIEYEQDSVEFIRSYELDSITAYVERNNLSNVSVYTANYGVEKVFANAYPKLELYCSPVGWVYPATVEIDLDLELTTTDFTKHFWCGNWRYASHRHLLASYMAHQHLDKTHLSWIYESSDTILKDHIWFNIDKLEQYAEPVLAGANKLSTLAPLSMNISVDKKLRFEETINIHTNTNPKQFYDDAFCAIVTETRYAESTNFLTEKIMNAILNYKPFIMVGPPGNLDYMRKWGFMTYNEWFDESYDLEICHHKRMIKIFKLIDSIAEKSIEELREITNEMDYVTNYNYIHILNLQEQLLESPISKNKIFNRIKHAS